MGIDACASAKSPDLLEPAMIPKKTESSECFRSNQILRFLFYNNSTSYYIGILYIPVHEGKNMPTKRTKEVYISAKM